MEKIKNGAPNASSAPKSDTHRSPTELPYHAFEITKIEPCAIYPDGLVTPVHMLTCGHLVAIDSTPNGIVDNRCGLNCLHVAHWMKQQTLSATIDNINLRTQTQTIPNSTPPQITKDAVLPAISQHQSHDNIFCEICHGLPASSYFIVPRDARRALAFTRPVIEHFTGLTNEQLARHLHKPCHKPYQVGLELTHILHCGHKVWAQPARPCAANCSDTTECASRMLAGNTKQGDAIFCHECVYRAEMVYERYAQVGRSLAHTSQSQMELRGVLVPGRANNRPQLEFTYAASTSASYDYRGHPAADGFPPDLVSEQEAPVPTSEA